jgi:uncharacterized protein (TIGR02145 family)
MKETKIITTFIGVSMLLFSHRNINSAVISDTISFGRTAYTSVRENRIDIKSVRIGNQDWAAENLNVSTFRNGDPIPEAKTAEEWYAAYKESKPAWCYYNNDPENAKKYGKLYNWYCVNDPRGLTPAGWHVPSNPEWAQLIDHLGGNKSAAPKMKSSKGWSDNGDNKSNFNGLPGGYRRPNGNFSSERLFGYWWASSEYLAANAWDRILYYNDTVVRSNHHKATGLSVRCIKD